MKTVDEKTVEEFFSQHFAENPTSGLVISPTLARKINETSSESGEDCVDEEKDMVTKRQLMTMTDKICNELDKRTENLNTNFEITYEENRLNYPHASNSYKYGIGYSTSKENNTKPVKGIRLKFKAKNAVTEYNENFSGPNIKTNINGKELTDNKANTPLIRRKRKLYSSKDEKCNESWHSDCENVSEAVSNKKSKITFYKGIEKERREYERKLRTRKLKKIFLSPESNKMNDMLDKLKNNNNSNEKFILVDKANDVSIYNFASDSTDDDFRLSKVKRNNITSGSSVKAPSIKDKIKEKVNVKRKRSHRPKLIIKFEKSAEPLIDERMRKTAVDVLNTSLEIQKPLQSKINMEPAPKLAMKHKMEGITDDEVKITENFKGNSVKKRQKRNGKALSLNKKKRSKQVKKTTLLSDTSDGTVSPLPDLIIEKVPARKDNDPLTSDMIERFQKMFEKLFDTKGGELNTTHNVNKDDDYNERNSCSHMFNITEELNQIPKSATSQDCNKQKVEDTQKICDSYSSNSSVNDLLKRPVPTTSRAESLEFGFRENMLSVLEKLDTTLTEINYNTDKKFINLFLEAQKELNQMKDQRRTQYEEVANSLLSDIVKLIEVRFSELDRRSQEMDEQYKEDLKERARKVILDDCRQKRAMVTLLREDVQAVLDFVHKDKTKKLET
ncbi:unnamed protein product [Parnassius apollo]|uniref:(apollo) hypothetical protein n=1 Tax=Parnassius apollo TaxID=110799 RepID=A0A8S3X7W2_PARAO|nr:unnamed protein product [Parnassius apollo]